MRIGSQSMSSTIDPKTICNKEVKQVSLANSQTSTQLLAHPPLLLNGEKKEGRQEDLWMEIIKKAKGVCTNKRGLHPLLPISTKLICDFLESRVSVHVNGCSGRQTP